MKCKHKIHTLMPRQHRLRRIIEVAKAAPTTIVLPRRLGRTPALLGNLRRATVGQRTSSGQRNWQMVS